MRQFAMGVIYAIPSGATPTGIPIAAVRDASQEDSSDKSPFWGEKKYAIDVGEGKAECSLKIKSADFHDDMIGLVISGSTSAAGSVLPAVSEPATIPASPFQVTVAQSATFVEDAIVYNFNLGKRLTRVASAPTTGQYSVAAGVYTFAAADTTHKVEITYSYSSASVGKTRTMNNAAMGPSTGFKVRLYNLFRLPTGTVVPKGREFPNVHFKKLSVSYKGMEWSEQDLEGFAIQDLGSPLVWKDYLGE